MFNKEKPVLLQVGIKANKNFIRVIKAIKGISCVVKIVGKPTGEMVHLLEKSGIEFSWKAELTQPEIIQQYVECDIVVFASLYEGFGVPIIEANAIERPVITSNCSSMPEVAGGSACLVDPLDITSIRNGILRVIGDDKYRESLIEAGRANRKRFEVKTITDQYIRLYEEVYAANQ